MVPAGIVCLLSAARFHDLTTQLPNAVWMLIPHKARAPKSRQLQLEIVRTSSARAMKDGIIEANIEGVKVPITSPARTVADCFKYRGRVGLDVAIEALRDALKHRISSADELMHFAQQNRVGTIMAPYVEALTL
ncbi:type IV toxin-antitoxin system AbiEi family antitoxin domain-containing protein [Hyphomonas sp. NPDC076900]|uniref:type IV toxin-antitoxin system AbiEi family antitoxin domain-containing protein n=1 Tax=unclassified Hyphomonas TaxID=2630699 RepID=UPI003D01FFD3